METHTGRSAAYMRASAPGFCFIEFEHVADAERALAEITAAQGPEGDALLASVAKNGYTPEQKRARQWRRMRVMSKYARPRERSPLRTHTLRTQCADGPLTPACSVSPRRPGRTGRRCGMRTLRTTRSRRRRSRPGPSFVRRPPAALGQASATTRPRSCAGRWSLWSGCPRARRRPLSRSGALCATNTWDTVHADSRALAWVRWVLGRREYVRRPSFPTRARSSTSTTTAAPPPCVRRPAMPARPADRHHTDPGASLRGGSHV